MSKVEVNTIEPQCGTTLTVGKCTTSVAVPGNVVKSNALQASDAGNIINQCGTTITLGASGDTVSLASGATQSGFGRTGTVDWNTTKITADPANAVSGTGYFCDTSGGAFTVTLPTSPSAGDIVAVADYTRTWNSNNLTIGRNSKPIGGVADDAVLIVEGQSATFVFVDDTEGWINTQETQTSQTGQVAAYVVATGGTPCSGAIVCTNYKVHTFTGPGTLTVPCVGNPGGSSTVDYLVVAGGAGGGKSDGGGGGAGGYRESPGTASGCYTTSPLGAAPAVALPVAGGPYPITIGGGGAGYPPAGPVGGPGVVGNPSTFSCITSAGGGTGSGGPGPQAGGPGGSGGGSFGPAAAGVGNDPPTNPAQGQPGGLGPGGGGGGGGATVAGSTGPSPAAGGAGATTCITGSPITKSAGGEGDRAGGGSYPAAPCNSGNGGGGICGGGCGPGPSGAGGSGIVVIRYKFQN